MQKIPVYEPYLLGNATSYVNECLSSGWISSRGSFITRFEEAFAEVLGANGATSVSNGTVALHLALTALGIGPDDEVIVPTLTYVASVNTILQTGATPIFVDSLEDTLQIDPESVRLAITRKTKAIMPVHLYGHPCDMDSLAAICDEFNLLMVEDAAEAFGSRWKGRSVGTFGDIATFSFFGNKTITTGEGGMVVAKNSEVLETCRHLKSQGVSKDREYWHDVLAYNYRMTNIQAAIGLSQIEILPEIKARKEAVATAYRSQLAGLALRTHDPVGDIEHSYWMCSIILDDPRVRNPLRSYLAEHGIETRPFFPPAHTMPHCAADRSLPVAESLSARGINLPSYPGLTNSKIDHICTLVRQGLAAVEK